MALTPKQAAFVREYLVDFNGTQAAIRAGYKPKSAGQQADENLKKPQIAAAVKEAIEARARRTELTADDVLREWGRQALTDRNEVAELRRGACRFCHGKDHRYQETPAEREGRKRAHDQLLKVTPTKEWVNIGEFDELGGIGYTPKKEPSADCPECFGDGVERIILKDTTLLSPEAKSLYEGIDYKNGVPVVKTVGREKALEMAAKHLGMLRDQGDGDAGTVVVYGSPSANAKQ